MPTKNRSNELHLTRIYDAPVQLVWDAWTDPEQVAQWWGPRGFTLTTHSKDLRPGGHWTYTMHGPDGTDYPNKTVYFEVEPGRKLVYDHGGNDDRPPLFRVTVLFTAQGGKTKMDLTMSLATPEAAEEIRKFIHKAGGNATWDRLAEHLEHESSGKEKFVINRSFAAPVAVVFEMWTDPQHIVNWLPPSGFTMRFLRSDIRPGGSSFYFMTNDAGIEFYGRNEYQTIERPTRLIYTQQFCDANEALSNHPLAPIWPPTLLTIVELNEEGPDQTRVTVTCEPHGNVTREELAVFIQARGGMTQGWSGSFDKLDSYLGGVKRENY